MPTATATASAKPGPVETVGTVLGRYRLEGELGRGAVGIVHAAFDQELERWIALKVLRSPSAPREAKDRLLREARAMARLAHPNVVSVYEVGTAAGRDFVAMELVRGETLAAWLRSRRSSLAAILDAFLAAGRGLAAAHAARIVHRDFKPSNVLCSRDGRIMVTDFGLAREAEAPAAALDGSSSTGPSTARSGSGDSPAALAGLTVTGAVLGTPPYMAPEQWSGGAITPATDQFAYCVALWEALAGQRPYRGTSREEIRTQILRGPAALDASRIPRGLRDLLRRGLHPDPAQRWPSMEAVLLRLRRARRWPRLRAPAGIAATCAIAAAVLVAIQGSDAATAACERSEIDIAKVWSPSLAAETATQTSAAHAEVLATAFDDWQAARSKACTAPPKVRFEQLQCLDGALRRFALLRRAYLHVPNGSPEALKAQMVDPEICRRATPADVPQLTLTPNWAVVEAYALLGRSETAHKPGDAEIASFLARTTSNPCARAVASLAFSLASNDVRRAHSLMIDAFGEADQCGDERLLADLRIQDIRYHWESPIIGPHGEAAIRQAESAAVRVLQPELTAVLALHRAVIAHQRGRWDEALQWIEDELAAYRARGETVGQLHAVIMRNYLRLGRAIPGDLEAIAGDVQVWRAGAIASHQSELARQLDVLAAQARFLRGDVSGSHVELLRMWQAQPVAEPIRGARRITGEVVDPHGLPIAGARIAVGSSLLADSEAIDRPRLDPFEDFRDLDLRIATSDAFGHFAIEDAAPAGVIAAQFANLRAGPVAIADHVKLVLEPTRSIAGKVELGSTLHTHVEVFCTPVEDRTGRFMLIAPVAQDGSFTLAGAPVRAVRLGVLTRGVREYDHRLEARTLPASSAEIFAVQLDLPSSRRTVDVVVRSTLTSPLEGAEVAVLTGRHVLHSMEDMLELRTTSLQRSPATPTSERYLPASVQNRARSGELVAHFEQVSPGELTVCAGPYGDALDRNARHLRDAHLAQIAVSCKQVGPDSHVIELAVAPQRRFD